MAETANHKFRPETTNGGNCFSDCSCGWSGGVHSSRFVAREAWVGQAVTEWLRARADQEEGR